MYTLCLHGAAWCMQEAASQRKLVSTLPGIVVSSWVPAQDLPWHDADPRACSALRRVCRDLLARRPQSKRERSCPSAQSLQPSAACGATFGQPQIRSVLQACHLPSHFTWQNMQRRCCSMHQGKEKPGAMQE